MARRSLSLDSKDIDLLASTCEVLGENKSLPAGERNTLFRVARSLRRQLKTPQRASAKAKGMLLQHEVCSRLAALLSIPFNNSDDTCEIHSRGSGQQGTDIVLTGAAREQLPLDIECKATKDFSFKDSLSQARSNTAEGRIPAVVHRPLNGELCVIFDWPAFESLVQKYVI